MPGPRPAPPRSGPVVAGGAAPAGTLRRRIGPVLLTFYGVGVMVGAGIYVLVGKIAALTGPFAPLAFVLAALIALPVALSYAELSSRLPEAAGEVAYVESGLGRPLLAAAAGLGIVIAGTVSAAAVLRGGTGYLVSLLPLPPEAVMVALALGLSAVAVAGVLESLALAAVMTAIEVGGLALVILAGIVGTPVEAAPAPDGSWLAGMGPAVLLAFFAFIGFEDMVNLAEETRAPTRTMPRAIIAALALTAALYLSVAWAAVRVASPAELGGSERPLAL
ncbi:MAG: amino acid permease, partial [Alphaproteobacteria bacterium]